MQSEYRRHRKRAPGKGNRRFGRRDGRGGGQGDHTGQDAEPRGRRSRAQSEGAGGQKPLSPPYETAHGKYRKSRRHGSRRQRDTFRRQPRRRRKNRRGRHDKSGRRGDLHGRIYGFEDHHGQLRTRHGSRGVYAQRRTLRKSEALRTGYQAFQDRHSNEGAVEKRGLRRNGASAGRGGSALFRNVDRGRSKKRLSVLSDIYQRGNPQDNSIQPRPRTAI